MQINKFYRIFCSVSGGVTSAVMASLIRQRYPFAEIRFGMANTTRETRPTMLFARNVDRFLELNMGLVEAVVHPGRKASTHNLVTWDEARMNGEAMEAVFAKYGIATLGHMHCTRETKTNPLRSWLADTGWAPGTYRIALGIRADEQDRINPEARNSIQFMYPLAEMGLTLDDVTDIASDWPFKLEQPPHEGNCIDCHKKSVLKTVINIKNHRDWFDFADRMDREHGGGRKRYRGGRTTAEMIALADATETPDPRVLSNEESGCATACNPWSDEMESRYVFQPKEKE